MISKYLTIVAAVVLMSGAAMAQNNGAAPAATPPASTTAAPTAAPTPPPAAPTVTTPAPSKPQTSADQDNPYGLMDIIHKGNPVSLGVLALLGIMSVGSWYIFFVKYLEQSRILGQARSVERRFWSSGTLNEGIDKLPKNSMFRLIAESGVRASQGGIAFLASVGSTAPFVGLFGTVWGILQALIAIGVAGQASIDKVAGPVGEALIMTAIGLFVAVPAVLCYNFLVRRNKVITEKLRGFAGDLQTYLISKSK